LRGLRLASGLRQEILLHRPALPGVHPGPQLKGQAGRGGASERWGKRLKGKKAKRQSLCSEKLPVVSGKWSGKNVGWALPTILIILAAWKSSRRGGSRTAPAEAFHNLRVGQRPMSDCSEKFLVAPASCRCGKPAGSLRHQRRRARRPAPPTFSCFSGGPRAHARLLGKVFHRVRTAHHWRAGRPPSRPFHCLGVSQRLMCN